MNVLRVFLDEVEKTESVFETSTLCSVTVQGVYPTLTVQDLRATGSGETYSKLQLWNLFSLERLLSVRFISFHMHSHNSKANIKLVFQTFVVLIQFWVRILNQSKR